MAASARGIFIDADELRKYESLPQVYFLLSGTCRGVRASGRKISAVGYYDARRLAAYVHMPISRNVYIQLLADRTYVIDDSTLRTTPVSSEQLLSIRTEIGIPNICRGGYRKGESTLPPIERTGPHVGFLQSMYFNFGILLYMGACNESRGIRNSPRYRRNSASLGIGPAFPRRELGFF